MAIRLKMESILVYHDGPVLFIGTDDINTKYLCQLVERGEHEDGFLCISISKGRLKQVLRGSTDLRDIFANPEVKVYYKLNTDSFDEMTMSPIDADIDSRWLPDEGFNVSEFISKGSELSAEDGRLNDDARIKNSAILHLSVAPPEAINEPRISSKNLIQVLSMVRSLVKNSFKRSISDLDTSRRRVLDVPDNYELEVYGFAEGSFTIHIQSKSTADLWGSMPIQKGLKLIDELTSNIDNVEANVETIRKYKGRIAKSYIDLMKFIIENDAPIRYAWTIPGEAAVSHRSITKEIAEPIYDELIKTEELGTEIIVLVGRVIKVNIKSGSWTIHSNEDNKQYSGSLLENSTFSLDGITVGTKDYKFICEEVVLLDVGTGNEKLKLFLQSLEELPPRH